MNSEENIVETSVPRFLDDLELIDRKRMRLDSQGNQRWSLTERREDDQVFADMGVAPLNSDQSPSEDNNIHNDMLSDDIENRSPNYNSSRAVKKSYLQTVLSPKAFKDSKGGAVKGSVETVRQDKIKSSVKHKEFSKENANQRCDDVSKKDTSDLTQVESKLSTLERCPLRAEGSSQILEEGREGLKDGKRCSQVDKNVKRLKSSHQNDEEAGCSQSSSTTELSWISPECQTSPNATCGPHPALHRQPSSIPRCTTFDEGITSDRKENSEYAEYEAEFDCFFNEKKISPLSSEKQKTDVTVHPCRLDKITEVNLKKSDTNESDTHKTISEKPNIGSNDDQTGQKITHTSKLKDDKTNCGSKLESKDADGLCPLSSVDQAILDFDKTILAFDENDDLDRTLVQNKAENEHYFGQGEEKECFTAHDRSFCGSCEKKLPPCSSDNVRGSSTTESSDAGAALQDEEGGIFSKLSDEVILSVLQWLPKRTIVRCMHVCKRWRRLAADGRLWARVDLGGRMLPSGALSILMGRHPVVLRLANSQLMEPVVPSSVPMMEWRVQYLDLSTASVSASDLTSILLRCPGLVKLSLEALTLDQRAHQAIVKLTHLRALNLSQSVGVCTQCCSAISSLRRLEHLNVAWTRLSDVALRSLVPALPNSIQRLNLAGCRKTLNDQLVSTIADRCPSLVELDLSDAAAIGSSATASLSALENLEHLALSRCYMLQLKDYIVLEKCPSLQWMDAFGILPPLSVTVLQKHLPHIQFNKFMHSSIARPTVGNRRTSIWGLRTRD